MLDEVVLLPLLMNVTIFEPCAFGNLGTRDVCELVPVRLGCEAIAKRNVRMRVAVRVYQRLVDRVRPEFVGVRRRQRIDVQAQTGPVWLTEMLDSMVVCD